MPVLGVLRVNLPNYYIKVSKYQKVQKYPYYFKDVPSASSTRFDREVNTALKFLNLRVFSILENFRVKNPHAKTHAHTKIMRCSLRGRGAGFPELCYTTWLHHHNFCRKVSLVCPRQSNIRIHCRSLNCKFTINQSLV